MIFYITVLRALAAMLITNAHYVGVYPTDLIANGGLLGDVIFFAVSGFSLVNIKQPFFKWYGKRISRIYPMIWIITTLYIVLGFYTFDDWTISQYYLYPTYYHFVASIIVLYIGYYFVIVNKILAENIPKIIFGLFIIQLIVYVFVYDKSTYHIDTVREPMIRFLFFQSMLLGAYFRKYKENFINKNSGKSWVAFAVTFILYFITKFSFVRYENLSQYQIINQVILFILLYFLLKSFAGIDDKLNGLPVRFKAIINFIAKITLEIYVVQYVIIPRFTFLKFPLNWIAITTTIIASAFLLHIVTRNVTEIIGNIFRKADVKKLRREEG